MKQEFITKINGVEIVTVERDGEIFVPIKPICDALGIDVDAQRNKLSSDDFFNSTTAIITAVAADGKEREMFSLPVKFIYGWIATINPGKVAPEAREAVTSYRRECYEVLYNHFAGASLKIKEQNEVERSLLNRKAMILNSIADHKKSIAEDNAEIRKVDEQLSQLRDERLNPQPSLFP